MFVYGAFFCSPFEDSIEDLCSIDFNKAALTTIMISEYIPGKELKEYANSDDLDNILEQIFLTLKIAYKKYSFCHNDLHSGNIIIRELQELTIVNYNGIKIETKFIPQIIDYGKSLLMIKNGSYLDYLKPFIIDFDKPKVSIKNSKIDNDQLITIENYNNIGIVHPSYDWLRLLISLSTYMKNTNKLYKYIIPYLELDYKENDLILIWFEQIKQNKKCNSFVPKKEFDTAYYKNIFN
jgi:thiamine kinase-like enzyme